MNIIREKVLGWVDIIPTSTFSSRRALKEKICPCFNHGRWAHDTTVILDEKNSFSEEALLCSADYALDTKRTLCVYFDSRILAVDPEKDKWLSNNSTLVSQNVLELQIFSTSCLRKWQVISFCRKILMLSSCVDWHIFNHDGSSTRVQMQMPSFVLFKAIRT